MVSSRAALAEFPPDPRSQEFVLDFSAFLQKQGALDELGIKRAQRAQAQSQERFDLVLTRLGLVSETDAAKLLSEYLGLTLVQSGDLPDAPLLANELQHTFLASNQLLPIAIDGETVVIATADPFNVEPVQAIGFLLGRPVRHCLMAPGDLQRAIERLHGRSAIVVEPDAVVTDAPTANAGEEDVRRLEDMASEAPVIRLVHDVIARAVEAQASDIHIEPREDSVRVRYRLDGVLHTVETLPLSLQAAVTSRIKIMAHLNIAERRLPQDGRVRSVVRGKEIDLRVSTMPTMQGESVVLRILDRSSIQLDYASLGFEGVKLDQFMGLLQQPNGIILVTGPTGSGKTTTLYTGLSTLNNAERKLFTVEDPIEYQLAGVNQIQVQPRIGLTFAHALRSILRQDPDVIMVGEIRDLETAQMAIQAALTGHLVLSTVHTNSAAATVTRLMDMGVADYLIASTVTGILAQRLVRRLCDCAAPAEASPLLLQKLGATKRDLSGLRQKVGCPACRNTGFVGRTTISELLTMTPAVRQKMLERATEAQIEHAAVSNGMATMFDDGLDKALRGVTTIEEVLRATRMS